MNDDKHLDDAREHVATLIANKHVKLNVSHEDIAVLVTLLAKAEREAARFRLLLEEEVAHGLARERAIAEDLARPASEEENDRLREQRILREDAERRSLEAFSKANDAKTLLENEKRVVIKQANYIRTQREALQIARNGLTGTEAVLDAIQAIDGALAAEGAVAT